MILFSFSSVQTIHIKNSILFYFVCFPILHIKNYSVLQENITFS